MRTEEYEGRNFVMHINLMATQECFLLQMVTCYEEAQGLSAM